MNEKKSENTLSNPGTRILGGKLHPPAYAIDAVNRSALLNKLSSGNYRLTLIVAAAGFGKTTLLSQWHALELEERHKVAWLSLDAYDRDPRHLLAYIIASLAHVGLETPGLTNMLRHITPGIQIERVMNELCHEMESATDNVLILLDDYHLVASPEIDEIIEFLFNRLPDNFRLAIASRIRPELPLLKWMTQGQLLQIEDIDLRFSAEEARELLGQSVDEETHQKIYRQTEGWGIAMQMAKLLLNKEPNSDALTKLFSGTEENLTHYLADQVLAGLLEEPREFLIDISFLDRFCPSLTDAVRGRDDSLKIIDQLRTIQALLSPLGGQGSWYRIHPLFGEYLRHQLEAKDENYIKGLHRNAADWYADQGQLSQALVHAKAGGEVSQAADIISSAGGATIILKQGFSVLENILNLLPKEWVLQIPALMLGKAELLCKEGKTNDAFDYIEEVKAHYSDQSSSDFTRDLAFCEMLCMGYADARITEQTIEKFRETVSPSDFWFQGWANNAEFLANFRLGNISKSRAAVRRALSNYIDAESPYSQFFIKLNLGMAHWVGGDVIKAYRQYREAQNLARMNFPADITLTALANFLLATVHYERNNLEQAKSLIDSTLLKVERYDGWLEIYMFGYKAASGVAFMLESLQAAMSILDRAEETASRRELSKLRWYAVIRRIELLTLSGQLEDAKQLACRDHVFEQARSGTFAEDIGWFEQQAATVAIARLELHMGNPGQALKILQRSCEDIEAMRLPAFQLKKRLLSSLAYMDKGDADNALSSIIEVFKLPCANNLVRTYLDEGERFFKLLKFITQKSTLSQMPEEIVTAIKRFKKLQSVPSTSSEVKEEAVILSHREYEILHQLALGHPNKSIARNLELSAGTVKFHLRNIYGKFGVNNRTEALAVAYRHNLLK